MSKIKLALDVVNDLRSLADSIETLAGVKDGTEPEESKTAVTKPKRKTKKTDEPKQPEVKQPTLEEVRAVMAEKNRDGYREKVKAIIVNHGANKLTALDPKQYAEVLKEVGEIK
ncbi:rRNA biogenesis protein rrp5 [Clostridium sp. DL1XJH146]